MNRLGQINLIIICIVLTSTLIQCIGLSQIGGLFNTCVTDSQCKGHDEFCDHTGINPIGKCQRGYPNGAKCHFDRHCQSKQCHLYKCVPRKPVKDGPCARDQHDDCIESQYCSSRGSSGGNNGFMCRDKSLSGVCAKSVHCLSNKCVLFKCRRPKVTKSTNPNELNEFSNLDLDEENEE